MEGIVFVKQIIYDDSNNVVQNANEILCEVQQETGALDTIFINKDELLKAGFDIPEKSVAEEMEVETPKEVEWTDASTAFILDKYSEYLKLVGPMKKYKTKKIMWQSISEELEEVLSVKKNYLQCENRYKTIIKRKRVCNKNNSSSGAKRMKMNFEHEIQKICAIDDNLVPEVLQSSSKTVINSKEGLETVKVKKNKGLSVAETLLKIHMEKEARRKERHEEKMNLLRSVLEKENNNNNKC